MPTTVYTTFSTARSPLHRASLPLTSRSKELLQRLQDDTVTEVIVATNTNLDGEATAMYLQRAITPAGIKVTRLARGLPSGTDIEYADDATLAHSLESRAEIV